MWLGRVLAVPLAVAVIHSGVSATPVTYTDDTFNNSNWSWQGAIAKINFSYDLSHRSPYPGSQYGVRCVGVPGPGPDPHPDFSPAGGLIELGYYTANSATAWDPQFRVVGVDNWSVTVVPVGPPIPTLSTTWGRIKHLYTRQSWMPERRVS